MYLHLGEKVVIRTDSIIGIFDLDTSTISKNTRKYLARAEKEKKVVNVSYELPKSFILCREEQGERVYISQLSSQTLIKRIANIRKSKYEK